MKKIVALFLLPALLLAVVNVNAQAAEQEGPVPAASKGKSQKTKKTKEPPAAEPYENKSTETEKTTPAVEEKKTTKQEDLDKWLLDAYKELGITTDTLKTKTAPAKEEKKSTAPPDEPADFLDVYKNGWDWSAPSATATQGIKTVSIGGKAWMAKNLEVAVFRNGDPIAEAKTESDWEVAYYNKKPAWCYYNNDPANAEKYGRIYNVFAVTDPRGLAPTGWHIPDKEEWDKTLSSLPDDETTGKKIKGTGEGDYAFVHGGYRYKNEFKAIGILGCWWTSSKRNIRGAYSSSLEVGAVGFSLNAQHNRFYSSDYSSEGLSVRCVKD